jgi:hypothetical protein
MRRTEIKITDLEESLSVAEEQRDTALERIIHMERELQVRKPSSIALILHCTLLALLADCPIKQRYSFF